MTASQNGLRAFLDEAASGLGLDAIAVTKPDAIETVARHLSRFLAEGRHGDMIWMEEKADRRADPRKLWPEVRSIIMVGQSYAPTADPLRCLADRERGVISVYAKGRDYHDILKGKIRQLASGLAQQSQSEFKIFVDTAPLLEKPLAAAAGIGWQGKHTNLVSRKHGSWLFLGAILTTAVLEADTPEADHCGTCRRCIDICPTHAFPEPYQLDARRCLAYLTIEHRGHIVQEFRRPLGNRVFGCDDCLAVCPWNKFAETARETRFAARDGTDNPTLSDLLALDDSAFRKRFAGTPVKRTGRDRLMRNALIAAGNSGDTSLIPLVMQQLEDQAEIVRAMAVWALGRLLERGDFEALRREAMPRERDGAVIAEWQSAQGQPP